MGLEGIVSKRRDFPYRSGSQSDWIKVKCDGWREANRDHHELFERPKRLVEPHLIGWPKPKPPRRAVKGAHTCN